MVVLWNRIGADGPASTALIATTSATSAMSTASDMRTASSQAQLDALAADIDMSFELPQQSQEQPDELLPCPHIWTEFEVEATRQSMQKKYKSAIVWGAQTGVHGARRKVR